MLANGELSGTEDPKTVWESSPLFQSHKLANFRSCYNRYRKELTNDKESEVGGLDDLNRKCTNEAVASASKKRRFIDLEAESDGASSFESEQPASKRSFNPLYLIAQWLAPETTTRCISLAVLLPTGIGCGEFSVRITEDGKNMELTVVWPENLINIELLHRKWLQAEGDEKLEPYHPKLLGFESALKDLRSRADESVLSIARIALPFKVETYIHNRYNLAWRSSTCRMVYVDLREAMGTYGLLNDKDEFEEV